MDSQRATQFSFLIQRLESLHPLLLNLVGALAYYLAAQLGLILAIPPGYASPIWPAAGLALAGVLILGNRILPAIAIGSFIANVTLPLATFDSKAFGTACLVALFIGAGASLQAFVGSTLIRKFVGFPTRLFREKDVLGFVIFGGPVANMVAASIGVCTLAAFGIISTSEMSVRWWTWWVGDTIGVMLVAPLLVLLAHKRHPKRSVRREWFIVVPLLSMFLLVIFLFKNAQRWERDNVNAHFEKHAADLATALKVQFTIHFETVRSIASFYDGSEEVTESEFETFTRRILERHKGIRALEWVPHVVDADRAVFEKQMRKQGYKDFAIIERVKGVIQTADKRADYFPVTYVRPSERNERALGYDLASNPKRNRALQQAILTGDAAATERVSLVQGKELEWGFLVLVPIFDNPRDPTSVYERRMSLMGFATGVFEVEQMIATALPLTNSLVALRVVDEGTLVDPKESIFFESANFELGSGARLHVFSVPFRAAGRTWRFEFSQTAAYLVANQSWKAWFVLSAGLVVTSFIVVFLLILTGRHLRVEELVEERTRELERANSALKENQLRMVHTAKMCSLGEMSAGLAHEIKDPLNAIMGYAYQLTMLGEKHALDTKAQKTISHRIRTTAMRISRIVDGLKTFSRDDRSDPNVEISVADVVHETLELCQERFQQKGISLRVSQIDPQLGVSCRPTQLSQVLVNLLNNAFDAVSDLREPWVQIDAIRVGDKVEISVSDSGNGVPVAVRERIMQPFYTTKAIGQGTGLGLSISKGIVERANGELVLDKAAMHTKFVIRLPCHRAA